MGALVVGRRLFDLTSAWGGTHPMNRPVVVLTHHVPQGWPRKGPNFTFVTDGIEAAVDTAKQLAGDKVVGVNGGSIARQCLNAGLLDEIWVDLVPDRSAAGETSGEQAARRAAAALAERLGIAVAYLPGGHGGLGSDPWEFARRLHELLQGG